MDTATLVTENTPSSVNERIRDAAAGRIEEQRQNEFRSMPSHLAALTMEWDVERAIETEAPLMIAGGVAAAAWLDRRLIGVPLFAASMLLLHNVQGWYPMLPFFRRAGLRTTREIAEEAYELKRSRGDFNDIVRDSPDETAMRAYAASYWTEGESNAS